MKTITATLLVAMFLVSAGGVETFLSFQNPIVAKSAEAAVNYGKELRTAEFVLGGGTDRGTSGSGVQTFTDAAGNWPTAKPATGAANVVKLAGSNIHVVNAQLDLSYNIVGASGHVYENNLTLDVQGAPSEGTDIPVGEVVSSGAGAAQALLDGSVTGTGYLQTVHDVTALFSAQSSAALASGVWVIAGVSATLSAGSRAFTSMKLIVTYEADASDGTNANYEFVKTVRLPLASASGTDKGSRQVDCLANTSCVFNFTTASLPDLHATSEIMSAHVELYGRQQGSSVTNFTAQLNAGATSPSYVLNSTLAGMHTTRVFHELASGDITINQQQTLTIANNVAGQALQALGGEVVLTYRYKTNETLQAETTRYFMYQGTTGPGTVLTSAGSVSVDIANSGAVVKNAWMRAQIAPVASTTFAITSKVAAAASVTKTYSLQLPAGSFRAGNAPTIIQDLSPDISSFGTSTTITASYKYSAANNPTPAFEVFATFVWDGSVGSAKTKTVSFAASQQSVSRNISSLETTRVVPIWLPEESTKTIKSAYLETHVHRSDASVATIVTGAIISTTLAGVSLGVSDGAASTNAYAAHLLAPIPASFFGGGVNFTDQRFSLSVTQSVGAADIVLFANSVIVTYVADAAAVALPVEHQMRTVEYMLGGGTSATAFTNGQTGYVGATWGTTKPTARNVIIAGSNVRVVRAYLDMQFQVGATAADIRSYTLTGDATLSTGNIVDLKLVDIAGESGNPITYNSGVSSGSGSSVGFRRQFDVTPLLAQQSSSEWASGVGVIFGSAFTFSSAQNRQLSSAKLVITYESSSDFNQIGGQEETKTVRFPLDSVTGGDMGTRAASCSVASCDFNYNVAIPDWSGLSSDILSVHYEVSATLDSTTASNVILGVDTASSAALPWTEAFADYSTMQFMWSPSVGAGGFVPNSLQTMNFRPAAGTYYGVGGEVVVTYRFDSHQIAQTETVQYSLGQVTTSAQVNALGSVTASILNKGATISNVWLRVQHPLNNPSTITIDSNVGGTVLPSRGYVYGAVDTLRGLGVPTIIHDMSSATSSMSSSTVISATSTYSAAANIATYASTEVLITYQWDGSKGGTTTRTIAFPASQNSIHATFARVRAKPVGVSFPRNVPIVFHDGYLFSRHQHGPSSAASNITVGGAVFNTQVNAVSNSISENGDGELYMPTSLLRLSGSALFGSTAPALVSYGIQVSNTENSSNRFLTSSVFYITYSEEHAIQRPTFDQKDFRIFYDDGTNPPTDPWPQGVSPLDLSIDAEMSSSSRPLRPSEHVRVRINLSVGTTTLAAGSKAFQLEFAPKVTSCSAVSAWNAVENAAGTSIWKGYSTTPTAGSLLANYVLPSSNSTSTFEAGGISALNPVEVGVSQYMEYEWDIADNGAPKETSYCFRMTESDGTPFFSYAYYPVLTTASFVGETTDWQWFDDAANESLMSPLASMNVSPASVVNNSVMNLRVGILDVAGVSDTNLRFALQWSTSAAFTGNINFVDSQAGCTLQSTFCYVDGVGVDDAALLTSKLGIVTLGRHNEATTSSTFSPAASSLTEMEYTIKPVRQKTGQLYYFRLFDLKRGAPVAANGVQSYPSIVAEGAALGLTVSGVASTTVIAGATTTNDTTSTSLPFGNLGMNTTAILAHQLNVKTNAIDGYGISILATDDFRNEYGDTIPPFAASNTSPLPWSSGCSSLQSGCIGYHTTDALLAGDSTRFAANDSWAGMSTSTPDEVGYKNLPTTLLGDDIDVIYRVEAHANTAPGSYQADVIYTVTPVY